MKLNRKVFKTQLFGEELELEVSELAGQTNASVLGRLGDTVVLATVVMGKEDKDLDYLPLTVDYEERFYAAGKIIGSRFVRREGKPSDEAVLSGRLIDHTIRPLFDKRLHRDIQVTITILSYDEKNDPDTISLIAASAALSISDIPFLGPVSGLHMESQEGEKPFYSVFFSGPDALINMMELEGEELTEDQLMKLHDTAVKEIARLNEFQKGIVKELGKTKIELKEEAHDENAAKLVSEYLNGKIETALKEKKTDELLRTLLTELKEKDAVKVAEGGTAELTPEILRAIPVAFKKEVENFVINMVLEENRRPDGRGFKEVRELYSEVKLFNRTHGSGLFIRGNTQVLAITTLGSPSAEQLVETMETTGKKTFMLHYNFPQFSVGETGRSRGPGRREIGHGALAYKAIKYLLPTKEEFPYTMRVVAETLSSNGSSSMASTCAASLSLMDAGVPIKTHAAGIAVGLLMSEKTGKYKVITDIQGPEDFYGDMDFKIAGTKNGITAIQLDMKVRGMTREIMLEALEHAKAARLHIVKSMEEVIKEPRKELSEFAPRVLKLAIDPDKIGMVIGSGGKTINGILASCNNEVTIDIDQEGFVYIAGVKKELVEKAYSAVEGIIHEYEPGETVEGTIVKIFEFGAILEFGFGRDGMIHVSELKDGFVKKVEDVVKVGDFVRAKVIKVDKESGKISLSLKGL